MLNITLQRQWLDILEESKKKKAARDKQKKEAMLLEQQAQIASNTAVEEKNRTYLYKYMCIPDTCLSDLDVKNQTVYPTEK